MRFPQLYGGPDPFVGMGGRHPHIRHDDVRELALRGELGNGLDQRATVTHTGDDIMPTVGQQPGQALSEQH